MSTKPPSGLLSELEALLPSGSITTDESDLAAYGRDWTRAYAPAPLAVVRPRSTDEVARVVRACRAHKQPMVPSGGRTGLAGGAVAMHGELVLSLERMNRIDPVDVTGLTLRVDAGAVTEQVHQHCLAHGLTWPVDLASKGSSQVGGNLATNAGGVKVIRYGHARQWVLGLVVVTAAGEILELGGPLEKDNTGVDLRQLFIGSEGTLGIITEATLKLARVPARLEVALFGVGGIDAGLRLFESARREHFQLSAYELFTESCMARFRAHRGFGPPLARPSAAYVLVEAEAPDRAAFEAWAHAALAADGVDDGVIAQTPAQGRELWRLREGISEALGATGLPHKNDVALPVRALAAFCRELDAVFAASYPGWEICLFGHVGDGNLHINVMKPDHLGREEFFRLTGAADHAVFELVRRHQGSISAEHGIGLVKKDYLGYSRSPAEIALMRRLKAMMDPDNLFNPGKIFD
ncbi:MAG TPA: FAD-binding oxidoreductase [Kofleriaceae bacterium]|nr:FAD-binding oxidoreductase [Kofleriaceae bacterium]